MNQQILKIMDLNLCRKHSVKSQSIDYDNFWCILTDTKRTRLLMKIAQTEISLAVSCQTLVVTMNASIHLWQENFLCVFVKAISLSKIKQMIWYFFWTAVQVAAQKKNRSSDFSAQFRLYLSIFTNNNIWVEHTELDTCLSAAVHLLRNRIPPLSWHSVWLV